MTDRNILKATKTYKTNQCYMNVRAYVKAWIIICLSVLMDYRLLSKLHSYSSCLSSVSSINIAVDSPF